MAICPVKETKEREIYYGISLLKILIPSQSFTPWNSKFRNNWLWLWDLYAHLLTTGIVLQMEMVRARWPPLQNLLRGIFFFFTGVIHWSYVSLNFLQEEGFHIWVTVAKLDSVLVLNLLSSMRGRHTTLWEYNWTSGSLVDTGNLHFVYSFFQNTYWKYIFTDGFYTIGYVFRANKDLGKVNVLLLLTNQETVLPAHFSMQWTIIICCWVMFNFYGTLPDHELKGISMESAGIVF